MTLPMQLDLDIDPWRAVNDGVMGGISRGEMVPGDEGLVFRGEISLEYNGGFASVRRLVEDGFAGAAGVRLRVRGDGRSYQFRLRLDDRFDGIAWRSVFPTGGDWQTIELDLGAFEPVFRGRQVRNAGILDPANIRQIGFLLADKQAGPFRLEVALIEFLP